MTKSWIALLFLLLSSWHTQAQEKYTPNKKYLLTQFSFEQLSCGIVILKATLDNFPDSLNFILDTGSGGISLDSSTVEALQLTKQTSNKIVRGIAGKQAVLFTNNHRLNLPNLQVDSLNFHIIDYGVLTSVYGIKINGIIGYSFFKRFVVRVNYDSMKIEVYNNQHTYRYPKNGYVLRPSFSPLPLQEANIIDEKMATNRFILDTGAGLCALLSENYVTDSSLLKKKRKRFPSQAEGLGGKKRMDLSYVKQLNIGPYKFRKVPIYIFNDEFNVTSYPLVGGLIGNDILRRFNITFNYQQQIIHLQPNMHFGDAFDYSYTGLGIYLIDDNILITDVIQHSPAEKAGFLEGDVVISFNRNFTKNIQTLKKVLQNTGTTVQIIVLRQNELVELQLPIKSILH